MKPIISERSDSVKLGKPTEYTDYFNAVLKATLSVQDWFASVGNRRQAAQLLKPLISKLLNTLNLMRLRYTHDPLHPLSLDLNDSGYPTASGFDKVRNDIEDLAAQDTQLASKGYLVEKLVEKLLDGESVEHTLELLGKRSYMDGLKTGEVFLPFTQGELIDISPEDGEIGRYELTFGTMCRLWNVPILYHMIFEVSGEDTSIHLQHPLYYDLVKLLQHETSFESPIVVVATNIDNRFNMIHPKMLQRIRLGPLWSLDARAEGNNSPFYDLLSVKGVGQKNDFVLELLIEAVNSAGTKKSPTGLFGLGTQVREKFFIPNDDIEAIARNASVVTKWLMMPSNLHRRADWSGSLSKYRNHRKIILNGKTIHEID